MPTITIQAPRTGMPATMHYWVDRHLNEMVAHILKSILSLIKKRIIVIKELTVSVYSADMSAWAEKHRHPAGIKFWLFAGLNRGNEIYIHEALNKYEKIATFLHEFSHLIYGDNDIIVHQEAMVICMRIIQNYEALQWDFDNPSIARCISKEDFEHALRYMDITKGIF